MKIILASKSPRRKILLDKAGIDFSVVPGKADEDAVKERDPAKLVQKLAELKAMDVAARVEPESLVIGADTVVFFGGKILGKPMDTDEARRMLGTLSGNVHDVFSGLCVICNGSRHIDYDVTKVRFRRLDDAEISRYVSTNDVLDWAGSYAIQAEPKVVESIEGSYTNVVGFPMEKLAAILLKYGIRIRIPDLPKSAIF